MTQYDIYEHNTIASFFAHFIENLFGKKAESIIDNPVNQVEIAPNTTWNDLGAGVNSIYNANGTVSFDKPLTKSQQNLLKNNLYSKFYSNPESLNYGEQNYFLHEQGISRKDWDLLDSEEKQDNFQYGLNRMITRDALSDFEQKKKDALKDKSLNITDEDNKFYNNLKTNYDQKTDASDWDNMTSNYMKLLSQKTFGQPESDSSFLGRFGTFFNDIYIGQWIGKIGGPIGRVIGGSLGAICNMVDSFISYMGEEGDNVANTKSLRDSKKMLVDYYTKNNKVNQAISQFQQYVSSLSTDEQDKLLQDFDSIATNLSPKYEQYLKDNISRQDKLDMMSEFYANQQATGNEQYAAIKLQQDVQNLAENKQSKLDVLINAGAQFSDMTLGTLMSGVGLLYGIIGAPGSDNDEEHKNDSYWNNIIDNGLTRYANNVTTLHVWSPEQQELYKQKGWTNNEILQTTDEQMSLLNAKSFPEVLAQYGFTFGTMALSKMGSKALHSTIGWARKMNKERFLNSNLPNAARAAAKRDMLLQNIEDGGHVFVAGSTGTLEGGMEGIQTYEQTYNKYMGMLNNQIDKESQSKLQEMKDDPTQLYNIYVALGGNKNIEEFVDEQGNFDADSLISEIVQTNSKLNKLTSPKDNPLAKILGIAPDDKLLQEMHETAWKAGYIDFWINSLINGYINTTLKAGQHSKYVRQAIDRLFGNKNKYFANQKITGSRKTGFNAESEKMTKGKMFVQRLKEAHGEGLEEYYQELANAFGQGFVQNHMLHNIFSKYTNTSQDLVLDDFATNLATGLSEVHEKATSAEAIKSYLYGALSTLIGGVSVKNSNITKEDVDKYGGNFIDRLSAYIPMFTWRTGFSPLFTNTERNKINAEREQVAERLNNFFADKDKQDMIFNVMDSISHGRIADIFNELGYGDFAEDEQAKSLIDTLTIVSKLKGTLYGDSVLAALRGRANWEKYVKRDDNGNAIAEGLGLDEQISVAQQQLREAIGNEDEESKIEAQNNIRRLSELRNAVREFQKNATPEQKNKIGTSENQIIAEAANVASTTLEILDQIEKALKDVDSQYGKNLDDDVKESWVKTLVYKTYAENELKRLQDQYKDYFTELQSQDDTLPNSQRNGFTATENSVIIEHGTSDNVKKKLEEFEKQLQTYQEIADSSKKEIKEKQSNSNLNDPRVKAELRTYQVTQQLAQNKIERLKAQINQHKHALTILKEIDRKKEALGFKEDEEIVVGLGDMALLDPMSFFELINENNSNKFSTAQREVINRAKSIAYGNGNQRFDADMQRISYLSEQLDEIALEQVEFRNNPSKYNDITAHAKESKIKDLLKGRHRDFFDINSTGQTTNEDGQVNEVSVSEFARRWEEIKKQYENQGDQGKINIASIESILKRQEQEAQKQGKQTLYGKYEQITDRANADTEELKKTGYWNNTTDQIKRTISALHKYARSLGAKFNKQQNDYSEGGRIITIDDVLTPDKKVVEDFKVFLENEGIHENEYNTNEFVNQLAQLLSSGEQTKISEGLEELHKANTEQKITDNADNSNPAPEPVVEKPELQKNEVQNNTTLDDVNQIISDIDKTNLSEEAEQRISDLLRSLESRENITGALINILNAYMNNTSFTQEERNFWSEVYRRLNKPKNTSPAPIIVTSEGISGGTVDLVITPPSYVPSNNPSNTDKINELLSRYMGSRFISDALKKLLIYFDNNRTKPNVCFIVDTILTQDIRNVDSTRGPAVFAAIEVTDELKNKGLNFEDRGIIKIDGKQYQIIGLLNEIQTVTLGQEIIDRANQQLQSNQNPFVIKVNGDNLTTNNITHKADYLNNTSVESSIFQKFQEKMRSNGVTNIERQFEEFLKHLYYVQKVDKDDPLKKNYTWVYREEENEDYTTVYEDYNPETDVEILPSEIINLTYKENGTGTYRRVVDFFKPEQNTITYSNLDEQFFIHLSELFGGKVGTKFKKGSLYPKIANLKVEDFEEVTEDGNKQLVLKSDKAKEIENELRNYFYWNYSGTTFRITNDNGFLHAHILDSAGKNEICQFMIATPSTEGSQNLFSCGLDCGYSMIHNMLFQTDQDGNVTLRDQSLLQLKIQLDYGTLKQAIGHIVKEETEEEAKQSKKSFDRIYNLFVNKGTFFTTSRDNFEAKITALQITVDEQKPITVTDNISNPTGTDPNLTERGTDRNTGETNNSKDDPLSEYSETEKIAEQMKQDSSKLSLNDDETAYVSEDGKYVGDRLTHFINPQSDKDSNRKTVSTSFGNYVDSIFEQVFLFNKANELLSLTEEQLYQRYGVAKREVGDFKKFVNQVVTIKQQLTQQYPGLKFVDGRVTTSATMKNKSTGELTNVSGTCDIVGYDKNGNWYLFDVKTTRLQVYDKQHLDSRINENEEYWSDQLEGYARSLEEKYGIKFVVTQDILVPLTYSASLYSDENIYSEEENKNVNHKVLKDQTGNPVTGWVGKRSGGNALAIHLTNPNMRQNSKFWNNYEIVNGEQVGEQLQQESQEQPEINFTFGVVENSRQQGARLNPILARAMGNKKQSVSLETLQEWSEQNLKDVLGGKKTLTLTDPTTGKKRVITSEQFKQYIEYAINKAKNSSNINEEQKEKINSDSIISDLSSLNPQVAMRTLINDFDCM